MIYYFTPTATNKDLGNAYNCYMGLLPNDDDWACLTDRDTFFLSSNYDTILNKAIEDNPDTGLFTCYTNRVGEKKQCYKGVISNNPDIVAHKVISDQLEGIYTYKELESVSGFMMMVQKRTWNKIKFKKGLLGVDNWYSEDLVKAGYKIKLIEGLYMFHYYRLKEGINYKAHLK